MVYSKTMKRREPATKKFRSEVEKGLYRIPLTISREMDSWLLGLSSKTKASGGYKLPKSYILRALISAAMKLDIDVNGVKDEKELADRIRHAITDYR